MWQAIRIATWVTLLTYIKIPGPEPSYDLTSFFDLGSTLIEATIF